MMADTNMNNFMILSLNCARGEASTYEVLSFVSQNPMYCIVLLREPWLNANNEPPPLFAFDMFMPTSMYSKCVTYIRKSANLHPTPVFSESDSFLGISLHTLSFSFTMYNFYSPGRQHAICHLFHSFQPNTNSLICGDFNSHHPSWYGHRANEHRRQLSGDSRLVDNLVQKFIDLSLTICNTPGKYTHFPWNNSSPSIIGLTLTRGQCTDRLLDWTLRKDFGSDHLSTHLHLSLATQSPSPRLAWSKADWEVLGTSLRNERLDFSSLGTAQEIHRAADNYTKALTGAIGKAVPIIDPAKPRRVRGW